IELPMPASPLRIDEVPASSKSRRLISGFISGFVSSVLLQPLDLLKTRVQQQSGGSLRTTIQELIDLSRTNHEHSNDKIRPFRVVRQLWRGTVPSVLRTAVGSGIYFSTLHNVRSMLQKFSSGQGEKFGSAQTARSSVLPRLDGYANLISGALTRGMVGFVMMPITVVKVRYESSKYATSSLISTVQSVYKVHGFAGFFYGFGATFVRDAPYAGIYVWLYEATKWNVPLIMSRSRYMSDFVKSTDSNSNTMSSVSAATINAFSAAISASLATAITNPFDIVKTRMQLFPDTYGTSMLTAFRVMASENHAFRRFFDGLGLRISRKALASTIGWTIYEEMLRRG
ncbi:mitochondrial carrier domain-containing protein, partial [Lipomyces oligophaga]|uniref:mitochondrial carrier domain-containing protein n=1 Tax=Lipomyces oligophaga TaxID=45792 RepID=UPI0034CD387B